MGDRKVLGILTETCAGSDKPPHFPREKEANRPTYLFKKKLGRLGICSFQLSMERVDDASLISTDLAQLAHLCRLRRK